MGLLTRIIAVQREAPLLHHVIEHLIRISLEKPVYKEKLRLRSYGVPENGAPVFVELKKKYDGIVYKRRVTVNAAEAASCVRREKLCRSDQISREINWFLQSYLPRPAAYIGYDREAWAGTEDEELRITFDSNLRGRDWDLDNILLFLGDAQTERLEEYREGGAVDCDFLKVAHHGGEEPLIDALVASIRPELAVITCSDDEPESDAICQSLEKAGTALWLTRVAPVSVASNGESVTVTYEG